MPTTVITSHGGGPPIYRVIETTAEANDFAREVSLRPKYNQPILLYPDGLSSAPTGYFFRGLYYSLVQPNTGTMEVK
jgi:hypothetical protein